MSETMRAVFWSPRPAVVEANSVPSLSLSGFPLTHGGRVQKILVLRKEPRSASRPECTFTSSEPCVRLAQGKWRDEVKLVLSHWPRRAPRPALWHWPKQVKALGELPDSPGSQRGPPSSAVLPQTRDRNMQQACLSQVGLLSLLDGPWPGWWRRLHYGALINLYLFSGNRVMLP